MKKMAIKTFNLDKEVYEQFSTHCKKHGISMSKQVENFIRRELERINLPARPAAQPSANPTEASKAVLKKENSFSRYC